MEPVTIFTTLNTAEADLVCAQLTAAGFDAEVLNVNANYALTPSTTAGGVRVQVPENQAADAKALLDATINAPQEPT